MPCTAATVPCAAARIYIYFFGGGQIDFIIQNSVNKFFVHLLYKGGGRGAGGGSVIKIAFYENTRKSLNRIEQFKKFLVTLVFLCLKNAGDSPRRTFSARHFIEYAKRFL